MPETAELASCQSNFKEQHLRILSTVADVGHFGVQNAIWFDRLLQILRLFFVTVEFFPCLN